MELKRACILVVDDEPANVKLLDRMLAQEGYENVVTTMSPREAINLYKDGDFDLVLLDLNMPEIDGFGVMGELVAHDADDLPPIIVITAQSDRDSRLRALREGGRDFLTKPFDRVELMARIRNMLEMRLLHNMVKRSNEELEEKVQERTSQIEETRLEIIRRLGLAAEYRDMETGNHILRMSKVSALLGRTLGMDESMVSLLLNASPMHDVGKIGIPDNILLKPGKLEAQEWEIMKSHAKIGAEILSGHDSPLMIMASEIALSHHEKWDGSGYPYGLQGADIPMSGRIVAVADVFDALTSVRPYKKAWTVTEATNYMRESAGTHFDPKIIDAFMSVREEVYLIRGEFSDHEDAA